MATSTSRSFERFKATLARADSLCDLYDRLLKLKLKKEPTRFNHSDIADLLRSAIVLSVASMDYYFTARFAELLVPFLKRSGPTPGLTSLLTDAGLDAKTSLEMLSMDRPYRRIRTLIDAHFEKYTTQRADVVNRLFLAYGVKDLLGNAQRKCNRKRLVRSVELLVERRHAIVHEGDLNDHGKLRDVARAEVRTRVTNLKALVEAAHAITVGVAP